jgi:hypothetical protein
MGMMDSDLSSNSTLKAKTAIGTVGYGIASLAAGAGGVIALNEDLTILGIGLLLFGIAGFGWSCLSREWFFNKKKE